MEHWSTKEERTVQEIIKGHNESIVEDKSKLVSNAIKIIILYTYQSNEDADELNDISENNRIEPTNQRVENGDACRDNDWGHTI